MFNKSNLAVAGAIRTGRYGHYAQSVLFHRGGSVATDGYIVVSVTPPNDDIKDAPMIQGEAPTLDYGEFCVSADYVKTIKKGFPKGKSDNVAILRNAFVIGEGDKRRLAVTDLSSVVSVRVSEDGGPPKSAKDIGKMTPAGEPVFEITFNGDLLSRLIDIIREAEDGHRSNPITFKFWGDDKAVRAEAERVETGQKIVGLIMPYKK